MFISRSFYHLDPRWQILTFFNDLALEGAGNLEQSDGIILEEKKYAIPFLLRVFARAGVFSVWRPTSNEAIRCMMTGEGVRSREHIPNQTLAYYLITCLFSVLYINH